MFHVFFGRSQIIFEAVCHTRNSSRMFAIIIVRFIWQIISLLKKVSRFSETFTACYILSQTSQHVFIFNSLYIDN